MLVAGFSWQSESCFNFFPGMEANFNLMLGGEETMGKLSCFVKYLQHCYCNFHVQLYISDTVIVKNTLLKHSH